MKLAKCPFCGEMPIIAHVGDNKQYIIYKCPNCRLSPLISGDARMYEWSAKMTWNQRCKQYEQI